jgi:hypothetical protein
VSWKAPIVSCSACGQFQRSQINPATGMGVCLVDASGASVCAAPAPGHRTARQWHLPQPPYPHAMRRCSKFEQREPGEN